jgi:DNA gyrase subunit A
MANNQEPERKQIRYIKQREISQEMEESYIDYAMSVIISRALPDVRDGLKPVQRRILYTMYRMGLTHTAKYRKSAAVIGQVMAKFHPHGDAAIYEAMGRMAQDFALRYPLVDGQGNWGSIDGDKLAAPRYTECRLSKIGEEMLRDIEKETVNFVDNYDATLKEPLVLPSPLPQLLLNGSLGIAVGMATNIPPHNLSEVCDAAIYLIDHPKATTEELFQFIKGPDFPTGGMIFSKKEIVAAYSQGKGSILVRGKTEIAKQKRGWQILITEIPFLVQKSALVAQIAKLVQDKAIKDIRDVRDESDKEGLRIVIELKQGAFPQKILNQLLKLTDLQKKFHLNMLALVDGIQPKVLSLPEALGYFVKHRIEVVLRRSKYELKKAKERAHILEGLVKCLSKIDRVIATIKKSKNREEAKKNLIKGFKLTEIQAEALLETKLSALAKLERKKIEEELKQLLDKIKELTALIKSPKKIKEIVKKELRELKEKFGDQRRTKVYLKKPEEIREEDLIPEKEVIITLTRKGYIKRTEPTNYRIQKRGGKGIQGVKTKEEDFVEHFVLANTHDQLLFFTDSGKVFGLPVYEIPEAPRTSQGRALVNFLSIRPEEKILALLAKGKIDDLSNLKYLVMATKNGIIKKTPFEQFKNLRSSGLIAINLKKGDLLREVKKTKGDWQIVLITKDGFGIRFNEKEVRPMARGASGIKAIRLQKGDEVIGMEVIEKQKKKGRKEYLLVVTENGYGKMTPVSGYRLQKRGGKGLKTAKITKKTGKLVASKILTGEEDLIIVSKKGQIIRVLAKNIPVLSRTTQGVRLMRLGSGDKIASLINI